MQTTSNSNNIFNEGKCMYSECSDNQVSNCHGCGLGPFCYKHMGGNGFTKIYCWNCIYMASLESAIEKTILKEFPPRPEECPRCKKTNTCFLSGIKERVGQDSPYRLQCSYCRANCHLHRNNENKTVLYPGRKLDCCYPILSSSSDEE